MGDIVIKFTGIDQNIGALFLQFSLPENLATIDQSTIHAFFPWQYEAESIEDLIPHMAAFGQNVLSQQQLITQDHKFNTQQLQQYSQLIGTSIQANSESVVNASDENTLYNPDTLANPNAQIDQIRCIILEILAEEGLIPGGII